MKKFNYNERIERAMKLLLQAEMEVFKARNDNECGNVQHSKGMELSKEVLALRTKLLTLLDE